MISASLGTSVGKAASAEGERPSAERRRCLSERGVISRAWRPGRKRKPKKPEVPGGGPDADVAHVRGLLYPCCASVWAPGAS